MTTPLSKLTTFADLRDFQRSMGTALFRPLTADDSMEPNEAVSLIRANARMTAHERLEIYARQYWFRLLDCLYDDYPGLRSLLGQKRFHALKPRLPRGVSKFVMDAPKPGQQVRGVHPRAS